MSAINMVELAEKWKNVGPRLTCEIAVNTGLPKYDIRVLRLDFIITW